MKYVIACLLFSFQLSLFSQSLDIPLITTTGTAQVYVPVDEVHFSLSISQQAPTISEARQKSIAISDEVIQYLKSKNIASKYIQTVAMKVGRNYKRNSNYTEWDGYTASQNIYVCIMDPSKYDSVVDGLLTMDVSRLKGPDYKSSKTSEAMEQARAEAILISREKAKQLVKALGQSIGQAKIIKENRATPPSPETYSSGTSLVTDVESKNQSFAPGQLRIQASVTVSYDLKE